MDTTPAVRSAVPRAAGSAPALAARLRRLVAGRDPARWVLGVMVVGWALVFFRLGLLRHQRFGTFGFDLGIYDQGVWLVSRLADPFVTVRGIDLFGHHMNVVLLLIAPFYRLGGGPELLLALQVGAQASGAIAVFLLARDRIGDRWTAVALAAVLLLNPTYQFLTWEYFHPDALSIAPLLFAYWAARERRWGWFTVAAVLAMACKEDVALSVVVIGVLVIFRGDCRIGAVIAAAAGAWFVVATRVLIPAFNGIGPFYDAFFPDDLGDSPGQIVWNTITKPGVTFDLVTRSDRLTYYVRMLAPFAFVPLLSIQTFAVGLPMLAVNVLTEFPYTRNYMFHYSSLVLAGAMIATVEGIGVHRERRGQVRAMVGVVVAAALVTTVMWGASPLSTKYDEGFWPLRDDPRNEARREAVDMVPDAASVSAIYDLVPHLTHRERIYEFPVPWKNVNWGVEGENLHDPAGVEWIVVDRDLLGAPDEELLDTLLREEFAVRFERDGIVLAERVRAPGG